MKPLSDMEQDLAEAEASFATCEAVESAALREYHRTSGLRASAMDKVVKAREALDLRKRWDATPEDQRVRIVPYLTYPKDTVDYCVIITNGPRRATVRPLQKGRYGPVPDYTIPGRAAVVPEDTHKLLCLRSKETP